MSGRFPTRRAALAALGGLATASALPARAQNAPIRVGVSPTDTFGQATFADGAGFFKAAGLDVALVSLPNSGAMGAAVAGGSIDLGDGNAIAVANARAQGLPFYVIAASALFEATEPTTLLMVANASPARVPKDLEGKTVATIELQGIMQASIRAWMTKAGADPSGMRFVEMPFSAMAAACVQNRVDAAMIAEPSLYLARTTTREIGNAYAAIANEWSLNLWFANREWLGKNLAVAHTFAAVMTKTAAWANAHRPETAIMLQKVTPLGADVISKMGRARFAERLSTSLIQPVLDTAAHNGILKTPMTAADLLMPGFV